MGPGKASEAASVFFSTGYSSSEQRSNTLNMRSYQSLGWSATFVGLRASLKSGAGVASPATVGTVSAQEAAGPWECSGLSRAPCSRLSSFPASGC